MNVVTDVGSKVCVEVQQASVCHACGLHGCWDSSSDCIGEGQGSCEVPISVPCGFYNLGVSCWINSGVQALMALTVFKRTLARLWDGLPSDVRSGLLQTTQAKRQVVLYKQPWSPLVPHERRLAATFVSASMSQPGFPFLFTDVFYENRQDDAAEFVRRVLHPQQCPALSAALRGHMEQSLTCVNPICQHVRQTGEAFASLQLPLRTPEGVSFQTVQAAVDGYMPDETVQAEQCAKCQSTGGFRKVHRILLFPQVLVMYLNRWTSHLVSDAILESIEATQTLNFRGQLYQLRACVCHHGRTPHSGHYVTVARHVVRDGEWWLYDDARCMPATAAQVSTVCSYGAWGPLQCYVLLYER